MLGQFTKIYLKARWAVGGGFILITALFFLFGLTSSWTWTLAAAGIAILGHAWVMQVTNMRSVTLAMVVDITSTHLAVAFLTVSIEDEMGLALLLTSATVLIALFADGLTRIGLFAYSAGIVVAALVAINGWNLTTVDDVIAILFTASLVASVISAVRQKLVELEAVRAQTLGVVSHELRNNLTGVIGSTELLMDPNFSLEAEDRSELIELSHQQALDAGDIIEDLLIASRAERGVLESNPEPVDLLPLTKSVIRRSESADDREIELDAPGDGLMALADPLRYRQVLRNLLSNAIRYGGPNIGVAIERSDDAVSVKVIDDGEGIEADSVQYLFRPYSRIGEESASGSTGLGLWIGKDLARKMGGDLTHQRQNGLTIFELTLPPARSASPRGQLVDSAAG